MLTMLSSNKMLPIHKAPSKREVTISGYNTVKLRGFRLTKVAHPTVDWSLFFFWFLDRKFSKLCVAGFSGREYYCMEYDEIGEESSTVI